MKYLFTLRKAKLNYIKPLFLLVFLMFLITTSCKKRKKYDPNAVPKPTASFNKPTNSPEDDAMFLTSAALINNYEIMLGELAAKKGASTDVKILGNIMLEEHTKALKDLMAIAQTKNIMLSDSVDTDHKNAYNKLVATNGKEFDKSFTSAMVNAHEDAIKKFDAAGKNISDPAIKAWVQKVLPSLKTHLNHSKMVKDKVRK